MYARRVRDGKRSDVGFANMRDLHHHLVILVHQQSPARRRLCAAFAHRQPYAEQLRARIVPVWPEDDSGARLVETLDHTLVGIGDVCCDNQMDAQLPAASRQLFEHAVKVGLARVHLGELALDRRPPDIVVVHNHHPALPVGAYPP